MIEAHNLRLGYSNKIVIEDICFKTRPNTITTIIGPNGCGKSTLLKAIARCITPIKGEIRFQDKLISNVNTRELAKDIAILVQSPRIPDDYTVYDLVCQGRFPYTSWTGRLNNNDKYIINWAIKSTHVRHLCNRMIHTLSGGERQRACIAMALAQEPKLLILDEPTTHLDIAHQFEVMELIKRLNNDNGLSILMVLHDLNQAIKYSDDIMVMHNKKIYAYGDAKNIMQEKLCEDVFGVNVRFIDDTIEQSKLVIPVGSKEVML